MQPRSSAEIESKIYHCRTSVVDRGIHLSGDMNLVYLAAGFLEPYLSRVTGINFSGSYLYYTLMLFGYYFLMESLWQRTLLKYLTGSMVVAGDGTRPTPSVIALRSLIRFIPVEQISLLFCRQDERWWHDVWTKTYVVKVDKFQAAFKDIGNDRTETPQSNSGILSADTIEAQPDEPKSAGGDRENDMRGTPPSKSRILSANAMYYAVAGFFVFGGLLGLIAVSESSKALRLAKSPDDRKKATRVMAVSIMTLSAPAACLLFGLFNKALLADKAMLVGIAGLYSWMAAIVTIILRLFGH
jgi:uncharacterized RDD family membrane protein YckC